MHVPTSWHWSSAEHVTVDAGEPQEPFWQVSPVVQALLSSHGVEFALLGFEQVPLAGSQTPES
jgi:hypothetical protein